MKLQYETGVATLIQFVALTLLNVATGTTSVVTQCRENSSDCVGDLMISLIFFLLIVSWFAFVAMLGYLAQHRRSKKIALVLIGAETLIAMVAFFNARHHPDLLSLITSVVDLLLAVWIIYLAIRLIRAGDGRIVTKPRPRRRRLPTTSL